jgi:hypothetical protein
MVGCRSWPFLVIPFRFLLKALTVMTVMQCSLLVYRRFGGREKIFLLAGYLCCLLLNPEDEFIIFLQNDGNLQPDYTAPRVRRH